LTRPLEYGQGTPRVGRLNQIHIGADVSKQLHADHDAELHTVSVYNEAIHPSDDTNDAASRTILESIVKEEDGQVDWFDEQLVQIARLVVSPRRPARSSSVRLSLTQKAGLGL
jgi:bacterioferritin